MCVRYVLSDINVFDEPLLYDYEPHNGVCMLDQKLIWHFTYNLVSQISVFASIFRIVFSSILCDFSTHCSQTIIQGELAHISQLHWRTLVMFFVL